MQSTETSYIPDERLKIFFFFGLVLTTVIINNTLFSNVTSCSLLHVHQLFGGLLLAAGCFFVLLFDCEDGSSTFLRKAVHFYQTAWCHILDDSILPV
jgi:hypothetical protein